MKKFLALFIILILPSALYVFLTAGKERSFVRLPYFGPKKVALTIKDNKASADTLFYQVIPFSFINESGENVTNTGLRGKIWTACFINDTDKHYAPSISTLFDRIEERTNLDTGLRLLTFFLDSAGRHELKTYSNKVHAGRRQIFLTGKGQSIREFAIDAFYKPLDSSYTKGFSKFFLVDKEGCIRGVYDALSIKETDRLVDEIGMLEAAYFIQNEKRNKSKTPD